MGIHLQYHIVYIFWWMDEHVNILVYRRLHIFINQLDASAKRHRITFCTCMYSLVVRRFNRVNYISRTFLYQYKYRTNYYCTSAFRQWKYSLKSVHNIHTALKVWVFLLTGWPRYYRRPGVKCSCPVMKRDTIIQCISLKGSPCQSKWRVIKFRKFLMIQTLSCRKIIGTWC